MNFGTSPVHILTILKRLILMEPLMPEVKQYTVDVAMKPTNPKDAIGNRKVAVHHVPAHIEAKLSLAMLEGAIKYGSYNYRVAGVRYSVYYDACMRHLKAHQEGQEIDPDSGLPHLWKALACIAIIEDAKTNNMLTDDRPPKLANQDWVKELNDYAAVLIDKLPPAVEPYTEETYRQTDLFKKVNPCAADSQQNYTWSKLETLIIPAKYRDNEYNITTPSGTKEISDKVAVQPAAVPGGYLV